MKLPNLRILFVLSLALGGGWLAWPSRSQQDTDPASPQAIVQSSANSSSPSGQMADCQEKSGLVASAGSSNKDESHQGQLASADPQAITEPLKTTLSDLDAVDVGPLVERLRFAFSNQPGSQTQIAMNEHQRMSIEAGDERVQIRADSGESLNFQLGKVTTTIKEEQVHATTEEGWLWIHTNQMDGLMQELIVPSRPADATPGTLVVELPVDLTGLRGSGGGQEIVFMNGDEQEIFRYREIRAWDAHGSELAASMAWNEDRQSISWSIQDALAQYPIRIDPLIARGYGELSAPGGAQFHQEFGFAVDSMGDLIAASTPGSVHQGKVYLIRRDRSRISQWDGVSEVTAPDGFVGDRFGHRVRFLSVNMMLVSTQPVTSALPSLYLFERQGDWDDDWEFKQKLQIPSGTGSDLGFSLAFNGEILAAGTASHEVFVWHRSGGQWVFGKRLTEGQVDNTKFGENIILINDDLAVAAHQANRNGPLTIDARGKVAIFRRNQGGANQWGLVQTINGSANQLNLGYRLASLDDRLWLDALGSPRGLAVYRFESASGLWVLESNPNEEFIPDWVRGRFAVTGGLVREIVTDNEWKLIGELKNLSALPDPGLRDFAYSGSLAVQGFPYVMQQGMPVGRIRIEELLRPNMAAAGAPTPVDNGTNIQRFGGAIAIDQDIMVVGAPQSSLTTTNGSLAGRAYVFRRNPATSRFEFSQILSPNPYVQNGRFGSTVAISGGLIAVGAPGPGSDRQRAFCFDGRYGPTFQLVSSFDSANGTGVGTSVAVHSDGWFATGAPGVIGGGIVRVRHSEMGGNANWGFVGDIANPSTLDPAGDNFGSSLAIDGGLLLVGAPNAEGRQTAIPFLGIGPDVVDAGRAYLFALNRPVNPGSWTLVKTLPRANNSGHFGIQSGRFGHRVAIEGEIAAVSEPGLSRVHLYDRNRTVNLGGFNFTDWEPAAVVTSPKPFAGSQFGKEGISLKGRRLAVGDSASGTIHLFSAHNLGIDDWRQSFEIRPPMDPQGTEFGSIFSLDYDGMQLVAGLPGSENGKVITFVRSADTFSPAVTTQANVPFAQQLALDGDELLVGVGNQGVLIRRNLGGNNRWDFGTTLSPPDGFQGLGTGSVALARGRAFIAQTGQIGNNLSGPGRVNVFRKTALGYTHEAKLEDPNTNQLGEYAGVIASDGLTLAVGQIYPTDPAIPGNQASSIIYRLHLDQVNQWAEISSIAKSEGLAVSHGLVLGARASSVLYHFPDNGPALNATGNIPGISARHLVAASENYAVAVPKDPSGSVRLFKIKRPTTNDPSLYGLEEVASGSTSFPSVVSIAFDGQYCALISTSGLRVLRLNPSGSSWVNLLETDLVTALQDPNPPQRNLISLSQGRLAVIKEPQNLGDQAQILIFDLNTRYRRWLNTQFTASELADGTLEHDLWGNAAKPFPNGVANIARAYHGIGHNESNLTGLLPYVLSRTGGDVLDVAWRRVADTQGVDVEAFWSPNLLQWYRSGDGPPGDLRTLQRLTSAEDGRYVIERVRFLEDDAPQGFIRLEYFR